MTQTIDQLIKNWHIKASDDYFSKYVFEYLAFIAYLKKKKFTEVDRDRQAIQKLKQDDEISKKYLKKIQENSEIKESWKKIQLEFGVIARLGNVSCGNGAVEEIEWWNCSHNEINQKTEEEKNKTKGVIHDLEDWENMVEFWHSIRNNLFHGGKDPENTRDRLVVENGYKTLRVLVEILLLED